MRLKSIKKTAIIIIVSLIIIAIGLFYPVGYFVLDDTDVATTQTSKNTHSTKPEGVVAYIINLDRSKDRYAYVEPNVRQLGYHVERISGVDGKLLQEPELKELVDFYSYKNFLGHEPQRGTIGCSLSHIKAWRTFLNSNFEYALIFEDDVNFKPQELAAAVEQLKLVPKLWDLNNFETSHSGMPLTIKKFSNGNKLVIYLTEVSHAGAYIINRATAQKLLAKALPIKMPIDHYFTRTWELGFKFTGIEPRLVAQNYGDSEIAKTSAQYSIVFTGDGNAFYKVMYKIQSYTIRFLYNLKTYWNT